MLPAYAQHLNLNCIEELHIEILIGAIDLMFYKDFCFAGDDPKLVKRIVDPNYLNKISGTFVDLQQTMKKHGPWASAWVGESGGAYNSGGRNVSDTFLDSFW